MSGWRKETGGLILEGTPLSRTGLLRADPATHRLVEAVPGEHYARADASAGVVNVIDKGADPTGATASDDAFVAAMTSAFQDASYLRNRAIYVPSGTYLLTEPSLLNLWTGPTAFRMGIVFYGDGYSTRIIFRPSESAWLYDGQSIPGRRMMFVTFRNLRLDCDASLAGGTINVCRENGVVGSPDQGYQFVNCMLVGPGAAYPSTIVETGPAGAVNTDCTRFVNCRAMGWGTALRSETTQSILHYSIGSDWEGIYGPLFDFARGGQLLVVGGSIMLGTYGESTRYGSCILRVAPPDGASAETNFRFEGVKTEIWDPDAVLYDLRGKSNAATVTVDDCDHVASGFDAAVQDWFVLARLEVSAPAHLQFRNCDIHGSHHRRVEFVNVNLHNWQYFVYAGASVDLRRCRVNPDQASDVVWTGADAQGGLFRMRDCEPAYYGLISMEDPAIAMDVDMSGTAGTVSRNTNAVQRKSWCGFVPFWPIDVDDYRTLPAIQLPAGSTLVSIRVRKEALAGDESTYQLAVTNGDGSTTYGTSDEGMRSARHDVFVSDIYKRLTTANDQIVRITCTAGKFGDALYQPMSPGDLFIVEYL